MNDTVLTKAQELARALSQSPEYITMRATEDAAGQDEALTALSAQYDEIHRQIEEITLQKDPDFEQMDALTRELEDVQQRIKAHPLYQALQAARKGFSAMIAQVNAQLSSVLNPNGAASGGCGGNCAGCSGCS